MDLSKVAGIALLVGSGSCLACGPWAYASKFVAPDGSANDFLGTSVSLDGMRLIAGAHRFDGPFDDSGKVYVLERISGQWAHVDSLAADDPSEESFFAYSVGLSGDTAIVGAYKDDEVGEDAGASYVFSRSVDTGQWSETQKILVADGAAFDSFGISVSISGNWAIVGSIGDDESAGDSGAAFVYNRLGAGESWVLAQKLKASDPDFRDNFGLSVSIHEDRAIVGATGDNVMLISNSGAAYVFERGTDDVWTETAKLVASDPDQNQHFGVSVDIFGDVALVGASSDDDNGTSAGAAYVFEKDSVTGVWQEVEKITPAVSQSGDRVGFDVALHSDTAFLGSISHNTTGAIFDYKRMPGAGWNQAQVVTPGVSGVESFFARPESDCSTLAVGAAGDDQLGEASGAVYVFVIDSIFTDNLESP